MKDKAIDNALRLATQKKAPTYERPTSNSVDAHKDAVSLLNDLDAEFPHLADGYKKGGKVSPPVAPKAAPEVGSKEYWDQRDVINTTPFYKRMDSPKDPMWYISPEEYRKGNLGRKEYALSTGGRAGYATGGDTGLDTSNPVVDQSNTPQESTVDYVNSLYKNIMGRTPDKEGVAYWANQLENGDISQADVLQQFAGSKEFQGLYKDNPTQAINALYQTALGRAPDKEGLDYWTNQAKGGLNLTDMVGSFTASDEGLNVQDINRMYQDFTGKTATPEQLAAAQEQLGNNQDWAGFLEKTFPKQFEQAGAQTAEGYLSDAVDTAGKVASGAVDAVADLVNRGKSTLIDALNYYNIRDPQIRNIMAAAVQGESNFKPKSENSYSGTKVKDIHRALPQTRKIPDAELERLKKDDRAFFNRVYAHSAGNKGGDDGYNYRGRGHIQLTGRANYRDYGEKAGLGTQLEENPDLLLNPEIAAKVAVVYMKDKLEHGKGKTPQDRIFRGINTHGPAVAAKVAALRTIPKSGQFGVFTMPEDGIQFAGATGTAPKTQTESSQAWIQQINAIYDKYLHQAPSDQGLKNLLGQLSSGKVKMSDIDNFIKNSNEAKTATAYQTYRQQFDQWRSASDARKKFEADYVANEVRNGRHPFSPPANVGPQVPPMPQWDNNKLPEMTKQYTYPEYTPQELQQQYTPQELQQQGAIDAYKKQVSDWQALQKQYQDAMANWQSQVNNYKVLAAINRWDPNPPAHLMAAIPSAPGGMPLPDKNVMEALAASGAAAATGVGTMSNPTGTPIGMSGTSVGSVTQSGLPGQWTPQGMTDMSQFNKAFTDAMAGANAAYSSHIDPITGQFTPITWDPMTGVGIHSPSYLGPNQYVGKIEGYGNYGPVYNSIGSYNPSSVTGYTPPTATNFTGTLAYGPGFKKGGVVKPTEEDVEKALRIAKRKGGRVNTKIDKDPVFDMSLKAGGGAWTRKEGQNPEGGLNAKGRASAKAEGHDLKPPAPHPKTDKDAARRKSFCSRMKGMKSKLTSSETANDPDSRINKSLRAWNCHSDGGAVDRALKIAEGGKVWDKKRPKDLGEPEALSKGQKKSAKAAAKAAGRPYPNLVDNMRAAQRKK